MRAQRETGKEGRHGGTKGRVDGADAHFSCILPLNNDTALQILSRFTSGFKLSHFEVLDFGFPSPPLPRSIQQCSNKQDGLSRMAHALDDLANSYLA